MKHYIQYVMITGPACGVFIRSFPIIIVKFALHYGTRKHQKRRLETKLNRGQGESMSHQLQNHSKESSDVSMNRYFIPLVKPRCLMGMHMDIALLRCVSGTSCKTNRRSKAKAFVRTCHYSTSLMDITKKGRKS